MGTIAVVGGGGASSLGCLDRPIAEGEPRTTQTVVDIVGQSAIDKIDLVLVIDNSGSMADKQDILAEAVPQLVRRLVTPVCVDEKGLAAEPPQNSDGQGVCPRGYRPEFNPIKDINIGVISSSLGDLGSATCEGATSPDDQGRLVHRSNPEVNANDAPTYKGTGFLAWDPDGKRLCPGEEVGGAVCPGESDPDALIASLGAIVKGVGEDGCGYEAPLEAAYRFLVDPAPYASVTKEGDAISIEGVDEALLAQRAAFLRPDSLVAVLMLTDENDCSFRADNYGAYAADADRSMMMPREECEDDPHGACCVSCWDRVPEGCAGDGGCPVPNSQSDQNNWPSKAPEGVDPEDFVNENVVDLRCWDQKRRFGIDFLYPTDRYVNAFTKERIDPRAANLLAEGGDADIDNPLFFHEETKTVRSPTNVFVAGIVGVPWQLIARRDANDQPSLKEGLDPNGQPVGGFRTYQELKDAGVWAELVPDPDSGAPPRSQLMVETTEKRPTNDGDKLINGGEWDTDHLDLQYACIFDLEESAWKECTESGIGNCDCGDPADKPLCAPGVGTNPTNASGEGANQPNTLQVKAKAYPGTRILQVLNGMKDQGIPASICPEQTDDALAKNYGYDPAVYAIVERLKGALLSSCQPRRLALNEQTGDAPCIVIEASDSDGDGDARTTGSCDDLCAEDGRAPISDATRAAAEAVRKSLDAEDNPAASALDCLCAIRQLEGKSGDASSSRYACQYEQITEEGIDGWCYVDATTQPPIGNPDLQEIEKCAATEKRLVRFVGNAVVKSGGRQYITCAGDAAGQ